MKSCLATLFAAIMPFLPLQSCLSWPHLVLPDTFLWYIIWDTVYSIAHSFMLGLSPLDALEGHLRSIAETHIFRDPRDS